MPSKSISSGAVLLLSLLFVFGCDNRSSQQRGKGEGDTMTVAERAMQESGEAQEELINIDREFASMALDSGLAVAFARYAADSAIALRANQMPIIGRDAIGGSFTGAEKMLLQWEPQFADVSGDLGYTFGRWQSNPGSEMVGGMRRGTGQTSHGYYVTIWKKIDGNWRYVLDTGITSPNQDDTTRPEK
jgi:ketosteroid isomerase-like protein